MSNEVAGLLKKPVDICSTKEVLEALLESQILGINSLKNILSDIELSVNKSLENLEKGGRLIFAGAGTSGRLAAAEASELYPTFSWPKERALCLVAGGARALTEAIEGAEDDFLQGKRDFLSISPSQNDVIICISASGTTPYTLAILREANAIHAFTLGIACKKDSEIFKEAQIKLFLNTPDEVIHGSTRMSAGSAQKILLNMLTTSIMIKLNRVYDSFMVDVAITNKKLENRGINIVSKICGVDFNMAKKSLEECNKNIKLACVFLKCGDISLAKEKLKNNNNNLRKCLEE